MRRISGLILTGILLFFCTAGAFASSGTENEPCVYWVMDRWKMDEGYNPLKDQNARGHRSEWLCRVLKCYDPVSGKVTEKEIPKNWHLSHELTEEAGLLFRVSGEDGDLVEKMIRYKPDTEEIIGEYAAQTGDMVSSGEEATLYWQDADGSARHLKLQTNIGQDGIPDYTLVSVASEKEEMWALRNDSWYDWSFPGMQPPALFRLDEDYVLFWQMLAPQHGYSTVLYLEDMDGVVSPYIYPLDHLEQLQLLDLTKKRIVPYQKTDGEDIRLENLLPIATVVRQEKVWCLCKDYSSVYHAGYEHDEMYYEGRTVLLSIDLSSGQQRILYETGYEKLDYQLLWSYVMAQYGTVRSHGRPGHHVPAEIAHRVAESMKERPLQPDGVMEFFAEPFEIVVE